MRQLIWERMRHQHLLLRQRLSIKLSSLQCLSQLQAVNDENKFECVERQMSVRRAEQEQQIREIEVQQADVQAAAAAPLLNGLSG